MEVFVTRQPIFDRDERVVGYELLYRDNRRSEQAPSMVSTEMAHSILVDAFLGIGLENVTHGKPAYINCDRELLLSGNLELLDPRQVVLEVLETVEPDAEVVAACRRLVDAGYRIALDDFASVERLQPLLEMAEIVKIDVLTWTEAELEALVALLSVYDVRLLAEKVESTEVRERCLGLGFELFQGFLYSRPEMLSRRDVSTGELQVLRVLNLVRDLDVPDTRIEEAIRVDVSLVYKLLRMVNSAAVGGRGVRSLGHAIRLLGRQALYRWLAMLVVASARGRGGLDREMAQTALVRARFCELIARRTERRGSGPSLFLAGLFSLLDLLLATPMEELLGQIELDEPIRAALLHRAGTFGAILELVEAYENGHWEVVPRLASAVPIPEDQLTPLYLEALAWGQVNPPGLEP